MNTNANRVEDEPLSGSSGSPVPLGEEKIENKTVQTSQSMESSLVDATSSESKRNNARSSTHPPRKKNHPYGSRRDPSKRVGGGKRVIGVRLPDSAMVYRVAAYFPDLAAGDALILQTQTGEVVGEVLYISSCASERKVDAQRLFPGKITRIIRKFADKDWQALAKQQEVEKSAKLICRQTIRELNLPMKLAKVTFQKKGPKILFYFTSEGRIDFRELVRRLGTKLKSRIEMRHVGVRDETRLLGGIGPCGKELCCSQYLQKFHPVSVRMAKNQDLSLNPEGISGICGRLLCCLAYENEAYAELKRDLPKVKKCCWTQDGKEAVVKCVHTLSGHVTLQHKDGSYVVCHASTLSSDKPISTQPWETTDEDCAITEVTDPASNEDRTDNPLPPGALEDPDEKENSDLLSTQSGQKKRRRRKRGKRQGSPSVSLPPQDQPAEAERKSWGEGGLREEKVTVSTVNGDGVMVLISSSEGENLERKSQTAVGKQRVQEREEGSQSPTVKRRRRRRRGTSRKEQSRKNDAPHTHDASHTKE